MNVSSELLLIFSLDQHLLYSLSAFPIQSFFLLYSLSIINIKILSYALQPRLHLIIILIFSR